jgi:hypothetical protein
LSYYDKVHVYRHLTDDGLIADGTNQKANVDGSVTPQKFYAGPTNGKTWEIERMIVFIEDNATFAADNYGGVSTLTNGIDLELTISGQSGPQILDLLDNEPIKSVSDWAAHCHDVNILTFGAGNNYATVRWTFGKSGEPLVLHGHHGDKLVATINDALNVLVDHRFIIQGIEK